MFKLFEDYSNDFKVISIDKKIINLDDINYFNKLKFIKLDCQYDNLYILAFKKDIPKKQLEYFILLFNDMLSNNKDLTLSNLIKTYSELFDAFKAKNSQNQLIGLLSELVFILTCENNNINILKYYQFQNDKFDFSLPNERYLEIKHINELDKTIVISESQLSKLKDNDFLIGIHLYRDSSHGENIYSIFKQINFSSIQLDYINNRIEEIENKEELENVKVNIEKSIFKIIERKYLPNISKHFSNIVIETKYKLLSLSMNKDNEDFLSILKENINE